MLGFHECYVHGMRMEETQKIPVHIEEALLVL